MFKALARSTKTKQDLKIYLQLCSITCQIEEDDGDCQLEIIWKRGPQADKSPLFSIDSNSSEIELDHEFSKVSSFYTSDNLSFEEKKCIIQVNLVKAGTA
jgi:hypothetical protein